MFHRKGKWPALSPLKEDGQCPLLRSPAWLKVRLTHIQPFSSSYIESLLQLICITNLLSLPFLTPFTAIQSLFNHLLQSSSFLTNSLPLEVCNSPLLKLDFFDLSQSNRHPFNKLNPSSTSSILI